MKKVICLILAVALCMTFACTAFADEFVSSVEITGDCEHGTTTVVGAKDATCTEDGYTGDVVCSDCGKVLEEGKAISATGHNYVDGVCTVCGATEPTNATTGDNARIALWIGLMAVAAAGLAVMIGCRKKFA